jgi:hypothetical protein
MEPDQQDGGGQNSGKRQRDHVNDRVSWLCHRSVSHAWAVVGRPGCEAASRPAAPYPVERSQRQVRRKAVAG